MNGSNVEAQKPIGSTDLVIRAKQQYGIIVMHRGPHLDEIAGACLLRTPEAGKIFPGSEAAKILFVEKGNLYDDAWFDSRGYIPVGLGGNTRFNDHNGPGGRVRGHCAATLVADYIGVSMKPDYRRLLDAILEADQSQDHGYTDLATLTKTLNRRFPGRSIEVFNWVARAIDAIASQEALRFTEVPGIMTLSQFFEIFRDGRIQEGYDQDILKQIEGWIKKSQDACDYSVLELSYAVKSMGCIRKSTGELAYTNQAVLEWVIDAFEAMYADQLDFRNEVAAVTSMGLKTIMVRAMCDGGSETQLSMVVITRDGDYVAKAVRYIHAPDVLIVRNTHGGCQIYCHGRLHNLHQAARMIFWLELPEDQKSHGCWKSLVNDCEALVPNWHFMAKGNMLLCGSGTSNSVTKMGTGAIVDVMQHAFHPHEVARWRKMRNIKLYKNMLDEEKTYWTTGVIPTSNRRNGEVHQPQNQPTGQAGEDAINIEAVDEDGIVGGSGELSQIPESESTVMIQAIDAALAAAKSAGGAISPEIRKG